MSQHPSPIIMPQASISDIDLAVWLASTTAELLKEIRRHASEYNSTQLGHYADQRANDFLIDALAQLRPTDKILSEESPDDPTRLEASRVWIIDPLDGTRGFVDPTCHDWAIHIALWQQGHLRDAVVALPEWDRFNGIYRTDHPLRDHHDSCVDSPDEPLRIAVSPHRTPPVVYALAQMRPCHIIRMHSAGAKAMAVLRGDVDAYIHSGGQWEWDSAAPAALLWSAHMHASRLDGSALHYNRADPWIGDLLMCSTKKASWFLSAIESVRHYLARI